MRSPSNPGRVNPSRRTVACAVGLGSLASLGCSVATEDYSTAEVRGSTQAVLQVQRVDAADGTSRGDALAGFVRLPPSADRAVALEMAGLVQDLPPAGQCRLRRFSAEGRAVSELSRIDLLDAQSVELWTSTGSHELVPHAFPTVTDWIRGVVHASRDRDPRQLPAGDGYRWVARDVEDLGSLEASFQSPAMPADVTVGGLPWNAASEQESNAFLDLTWSPGSPSDDLMWVVLESDGQERSCSFPDADGAGSLPLTGEGGLSLAPRGSEARLSLHRVRSASGTAPGFSLLTVRFDFSLTTNLEFR